MVLDLSFQTPSVLSKYPLCAGSLKSVVVRLICKTSSNKTEYLGNIQNVTKNMGYTSELGPPKYIPREIQQRRW